jgi:hypothetical protein
MHDLENHHIIPTSENGSDHPKNIITLLKTNHQSIHNLFATRIPHEQILQVLSLARTATTKEFQKQLRECIMDFDIDDKIYLSEVFRSKK